MGKETINGRKIMHELERKVSICANCHHPIIYYVSGFHGKWKHFDGNAVNLYCSDSCRDAGNCCELDCKDPVEKYYNPLDKIKDIVLAENANGN